MKALVLRAVGDLRLEETPKPKPRVGEVLLAVHRCGICSSDVDRVFATGTYHFPTIPGHEFSGEIVELGEGVDHSLLGRRACVFPLLPCFHCPSCHVGEYARCNSYSYFGSRCNGGFAEYLAVPVWNLVFLPEELSYDAGALCEPASVALHAIKLGQRLRDAKVAVVGNGTIGLLAALWARNLGASEVTIIGRSKEKLAVARTLGFERTFSSLDQNPLREWPGVTDGEGADIVYEMVGSPESLAIAVSLAKKGGIVVLTGNPKGAMSMERNVYWRILRAELTLKGAWNSSYGHKSCDWAESLTQMASGRFPVEKLVTHHFTLENWAEAFALLRGSSRCAVKVMFDVMG